MQIFKEVQIAAQAFKTMLGDELKNVGKAPVGVILGTGLSGLVDSTGCRKIKTIPFADIPGFPLPGVKSHTGTFIWATLEGLPILFQVGRCHLYEGRSPAEVCMGIRLMATLGINTLIATNAAGAINPLFEAGDLMLMADMINFTGTSPLIGENCEEWGERFPDMSFPFDKHLRSLARICALERGIKLEEGVYIGVHGPEMETPAETRMYRSWGADAVGMSTVLEIIAARHLRMRAMGISCLTNRNLPDCPMPARLEEIIKVSARAGTRLGKLLHGLFLEIARQPFSRTSPEHD